MNPSITVELEDHVCCTCGTPFAMATRIGDERRQIGGNFYCPNGHPITYGQTEVKALREQLAQEQTRHAQTRAARDDAQRKLARVEKGICPHCKRHFTNVERHIASKHKKTSHD